MRLVSATLATLVASLALAAPGAAGPKQRGEAEIAAGQPAGKPVDCIQIVGIRESRVLSDRVIDFHMGGNKVYRNTLPNSCPQLGFERAFSYQTSLSQLCSTDIITVLYQGGGLRRGASCGLGKFQPITGVKR
jgi:hypothetical protein